MDIDFHLLLRCGATSTNLLAVDGIADAAIRGALKSGRLVRVRRGAFIQGGDYSPEERFGLASVAIARSRPHDSLTGPSTLAAIGLPLLHEAMRHFHLQQRGPELTQYRRGGLAVHPERFAVESLERWPDVTSVGLPAAIALTAAQVSLTSAVVAADAACHRGLVTPAELQCDSLPLDLGRGGKNASRVADLVEPKSESPGESVLRLMLIDAGIDVEAQVDIHDHMGFVGRVDLFDAKNKTVYEFDGAVKYEGSTGRNELVREKYREDRLRRLGLDVVRVTWRQLETHAFVAQVLRRSVAA